MRRLILQTIVAVALFAGGIAMGAVWHARRVRSTPPASPSTAAQRPDENPWPLTKQVVARSLQSHSFRTDKLRLNSNDDIVWRWLKESVANYPQIWVKLNINETESYGVALYPPKILEPIELARFNKQLSESGLPLVVAGKDIFQSKSTQAILFVPTGMGWSTLMTCDWCFSRAGPLNRRCPTNRGTRA